MSHQTFSSHTTISPIASFSNMLLSPITGAISRLSALRGFMLELPNHQSNFSTDLFAPNEFHLLGPKLPTREARYEAPEASERRNYFLVRETKHLALAAQGIVMVRENLVSSTKGDLPQPQFEIVGPPTRRDVIGLARITNYEAVKELAYAEIRRRNEVIKK